MPKPVSDALRNQWKEKIIDQSQSGLSIAAWCRQNNIKIHTFIYWRDKCQPKSIDRSDFKEVPIQQIVDTLPKKSGISLQYQEFCIFLEQQFDATALKHCLQILKELSC